MRPQHCREHFQLLWRPLQVDCAVSRIIWTNWLNYEQCSHSITRAKLPLDWGSHLASRRSIVMAEHGRIQNDEIKKKKRLGVRLLHPQSLPSTDLTVSKTHSRVFGLVKFLDFFRWPESGGTWCVFRFFFLISSFCIRPCSAMTVKVLTSLPWPRPDWVPSSPHYLPDAKATQKATQKHIIHLPNR